MMVTLISWLNQTKSPHWHSLLKYLISKVLLYTFCLFNTNCVNLVFDCWNIISTLAIQYILLLSWLQYFSQKKRIETEVSDYHILARTKIVKKKCQRLFFKVFKLKLNICNSFHFCNIFRYTKWRINQMKKRSLKMNILKKEQE